MAKRRTLKKRKTYKKRKVYGGEYTSEEIQKYRKTLLDQAEKYRKFPSYKNADTVAKEKIMQMLRDGMIRRLMLKNSDLPSVNELMRT
jgi:hypothetical protein